MDAVPLPDALDLLAYWRLVPPLHVVVSGLLRGLSGGKGSAAPKPSSREEVEAFAAQFKKG